MKVVMLGSLLLLAVVVVVFVGKRELMDISG